CQNNMKQIGLGAHSFHDAHMHFPAGMYLSPGQDIHTLGNVNVGNLPAILPYIEQKNLYELLSKDWQRTTWWGANNQPSQFRVPTFECPSSRARQYPGAVAQITYSSNSPGSGTLNLSLWPSNPNPGLTNYLPVAGGMGRSSDSGWDRYIGIFYQNSETKLDQVTNADGASYTLLYGEVEGADLSMVGFDKTRYTWMGSAALAVAWGLKSGLPLWSPEGPRFSSNHTQIVNFCMGDGSVRSVNVETGNGPLRAASGKEDGILYDEL
ncbi:MAG: DUF1559 domain-containing protein, partial [Gemmataceae bacterium]